ncbi:MAG: ComEC/Rec2 family competence protein [Planctomycetota bacterium]|nr:ComEC/Rec2 family competence protein [Planctomycetota bacterium]
MNWPTAPRTPGSWLACIHILTASALICAQGRQYWLTPDGLGMTPTVRLTCAWASVLILLVGCLLLLRPRSPSRTSRTRFLSVFLLLTVGASLLAFARIQPRLPLHAPAGEPVPGTITGQLLRLEKSTGPFAQAHHFWGILGFSQSKNETGQKKQILFQGAYPEKPPPVGSRIKLSGLLTPSRRGVQFKEAVWQILPLQQALPFWVRLRNQVRNHLNSRLSNPSAGMAKALLLGEKTDLPQDLTDGYRRFGILHLLAISGMHFWFWDALFRRLLPRRILWLRIPLLFLAAGLANFSPAVVRAGFALGLRDFVHARGLRVCPFHLVAGALWTEALLFPERAAGLGMVLTYSATWALLLVKTPQNANGFQKILLSSTAAFLATVPPLHALQGTLEPWSIPLTPLFGLLLPLRLIASLLALFPSGPALADAILRTSVTLESTALDFLKHLPGAPWFLPQCYETLLFLGCCGGLLFLWRPPSLHLRSWIHPGVLGIGVLVFSLLVPLPGKPGVAMLPVGHGLLSMVSAQEETLLFDVGSKSLPPKTLVDRLLLPFLAAKRWAKPSHVIWSHQDGDHVNGRDRLFTWFSPQELSCPQGKEKVLATMGPFSLRIYGCIQTEEGVSNQGGHALFLQSKQQAVLFLGDSPGPVLENLLARLPTCPVSLLFAPHHGRDTLFLPQFLDALRPREVWASTAPSGPTPKIQPLLEKRNLPFFETEQKPLIWQPTPDME